MSRSVKNAITKCSIGENTTQLSLWEPEKDEQPDLPEEGIPLEAFPVSCTLAFRWANGDTSEEAAQRKLAQVQGCAHYLYSWEYIEGHLVSYYVSVEEAWIEQGVVWGKCQLWPEGKWVDALRSGRSVEEEEDEEVA